MTELPCRVHYSMGIKKICGLILLTSTVMDLTKGLVEISPSVVAPVCQVGDQLELMCTTTGRFLRWEFTVTLEDGTSMTFRPVVTAGGSSGLPPPVMANSTRFTFSRLSIQPLTCRMTINPVSEGLNGIQVKCVDIEASDSVVTTIQIMDARDTQISNLSIWSHLEQFSSNRVVVILEWTVSLLQAYYQDLLQNISVYIIPELSVPITYTGNRTIQLSLLYNVQYNVSITQPGICGQPNQTAYIELSYSRCSNPMALVSNNVRVVGYEDPALEGGVITLTCVFGSAVLSGSNISTCMGNGEWEPDPNEVNYTDGLVTTGTTILSTCSNPPYVLQLNESVRTVDIRESEFDATRMCCSGLLIARADTTTCLENGEWELEATQMNLKDEETSDATLRTALILVTCVLVMVSALTFVMGFACGHCFSQRGRKSENKNNGSPSGPTTEPREDLELKENVAYITICPK